MENEYRLMKESMLQLSSDEFKESDFVFNKEKTIWAKTEKCGVYPGIKIKVEAKCVKVSYETVIFQCRIVERLSWLDDETPPYFSYSEFFLSIKGIGKKRGMFVNKYGDGTTIKEVCSRKLFMQPYDTQFMPREFYNPTSLAKRVKIMREDIYPFEDELMFAYLYWKKRAMEQKKYYEWIELNCQCPQGNAQSFEQPSC